jgi:predicted nucleic acid-binding protein
MPEVVIADASCLIVLTKIGELDVLRRLYGTVLTTPVVAAEFGRPLPEWMRLESARDLQREQELARQLDAGESSAIALGLERPNSTVILDDYKARQLAQRLGVQLTGTLGVLIRATKKGVVPALRPLLNRVRETDFRFSRELELVALQAVGEA